MPYLSCRYVRPRRAYKRKAEGDVGRAAKRQRVSLRYHQYELRHHSTTFTAIPLAVGHVLNLTAIAQGDGVGARQGNSITLRKLVLSGSVIMDTPPIFTRFRMMIVRDTLGSTTIPSILDMFTSVAKFYTNQVRDPAVQNMARFTVLWDKYVLLGDAWNLQAKWSFTKKLNSTCLFTGTGTSDEGKGAIYLFMASDQAATGPNVESNVILFYTAD